MASRQLPKLIFSDEDLPTLVYRRTRTSETELALRDVDRTLEREVRDEQVEILGFVAPEAGLAAEIEDVCTLDIVESIELPPPARSITPDDLPAIPISAQAARRAHRRHGTRIAMGVAFGVILGVGSASLFLGDDGPEAAAVAEAGLEQAEAFEEPEFVPFDPVIEPVVESSPAPAPVAKPASAHPKPRLAQATPAKPLRKRKRARRVSKQRLNTLDALLGL